MRPAERLTLAYLRDHPLDAARDLALLSPPEAAEVLRTQPAAVAGAVLELLPLQTVAAVAEMLPAEALAALLPALSAPTATRLLRVLPAGTQQALLHRLAPAEAEVLRRALRFAPGTAGSLADPRALTLPPHLTVEDALSRVSEHALITAYYVYVVAETNRLVGVVTLKELLLADPRAPLQAVMRADPARLGAHLPSTSLLSHHLWRVYPMLPVVERGEAFVGALRLRTLHALETHGPDGAAGPLPSRSAVLQLLELTTAGALGALELVLWLGGDVTRSHEGAPPRREHPEGGEHP